MHILLHMLGFLGQEKKNVLFLKKKKDIVDLFK